MKRPDGLKYVIVTLFERDGEPWIRLLFVTHDGGSETVETELDCRQFRINFDDEPKQLPGKPDGSLN